MVGVQDLLVLWQGMLTEGTFSKFSPGRGKDWIIVRAQNLHYRLLRTMIPKGSRC